jgi:sulfite exporter TauE/SafE
MTGISFFTAFIIGLIASISSCVAVVGGLLLSMSANFSKNGDAVRPQIYFHIGRLVSFFILGGVVGLIGANFQLSNTGTFLVGLVVSIIMIILGLKLLDIFPSFKKALPTLPGIFGEKIQNLKNLNHTLTPLLIGVATFFLPCGFTQSMQMYTLSTGSFWTGAFTMLSFALGTLPVLALLSFGSLGIHKKTWSVIFFKTAGIVVIFFGLFNLYHSLNLVGIDFSLARSKIEISVPTNNVKVENGIQIIELIAEGGYSPRNSVAQAGVPTVIRFQTSNTFDCSLSVRMPSVNISQILDQTGITDINIGTPAIGLFRGTCGMGMYPFEVDFR